MKLFKNSFKNKLNNAGVSLIELIIVITIMTIMVGATGVSIGILSGRPAQKAANRWMSELERVRTVGMGKSSAYATLYTDSNNLYLKEVVEGVEADPIKLASNAVICSVSIDGTEYELQSGNDIFCYFNRSDGSLQKVVRGTGDIYNSSSPAGEVDFIFKKSHSTYKVCVTPVTGRVVLKSE